VEGGTMIRWTSDGMVAGDGWEICARTTQCCIRILACSDSSITIGLLLNNPSSKTNALHEP
jgi:hypothetical protein